MQHVQRVSYHLLHSNPPQVLQVFDHMICYREIQSQAAVSRIRGKMGFSGCGGECRRFNTTRSWSPAACCLHERS